MRRLLAIGLVWLGCTTAWAILGSTLGVRSGIASGGLLPEVHALWGPPLEQGPPSAVGVETHRAVQTESRFDEKAKRYFEVRHEVDVTTERELPLASSRIQARLALEHRRKGLLWFPTYGVDFRAAYTFRNETPDEREAKVAFPLRQLGVVYDGFAVLDPAGQAVEAVFEEGRVRFARRLAPGEALAFEVRYRTRGTGSWGYGVAGKGLGPEAGRARDFRLELETDFADVDFPAGTMSPTRHGPEGGAWKGVWESGQIVGTQTIGLELPQLLNPGPLAAQITFFAPVSLLFFFFVTAILLAAEGRSIHPMHYFLVGCAFFAFHLLFAYLIDHVAVGASFAAASAVAVVLVVSYARLFVGWRTAALKLVVPQLVFLVLFSWTFFWKGFTGLAITVGAILTLFVVMQMTGRLDWDEVLGRGGEGGPRAASPGTAR
jgi:hypothetical protein